jgi:undecaprenyl-diphosphatase
MVPVRIGIATWLAIRRRWWHVSAFVSAIVVSEISIGTLKALYDRPRALGSLVETSSASFPSGHAVAASVTAVAAVIALLPEGPRRYRWGAAAVAFSFVMGLSRTYLGAHWLSDAVTGVLLGTTVALGTALVAHRVRERR